MNLWTILMNSYKLSKSCYWLSWGKKKPPKNDKLIKVKKL